MPDAGRGTNVGMVPLGDGSSIFEGAGTMGGGCAMTSWWSSTTGGSTFVSWITGPCSNNSDGDLRLMQRLRVVPAEVPAEDSGGSLG